MKRQILLGAALMAIFLFFATHGGLTATPKFWHDEAVPFEIARNIAEFGKADLAIAPNIFWKKSYMTHATGFPLTFPLAGVFKMFGVGVLQSRLFMIAWMCAALGALFFVMRAFFDKKTAFFSVLLVATFSSFYANGRTSTGEIPGFLFLLFALYFLYQKEWYGWGGFFGALAAVTKPSMYVLILPVIAVELLINARQTLGKNVLNDFAEKSQKIKDFVEKSNCLSFEPREAGRGRVLDFSLNKICGFLRFRSILVKNILSQNFFLVSGATPVLLFWIWLINPAPFSLASWQEMIAFYQNSFNAPSLLSQFPIVIPSLLTHSTLLYFSGLLAIIAFAWWKNFFSPAQNRLIIFLFLYGAASFFYFFRSPGWFRYLLGTELLILAVLPATLERTLKTLNYEITKMARVLRFSFFVGLPVTASQCGNGDKEKRKTQSRAMLFRNSRIKMLSTFLLFSIAGLQSLQYLLGAEIPSGTKSIEIAQFINKEILANDPSAAIGIVDDAPIATLIPANRKYQRAAVGGYNTFVGTHPLSLPPEQLPVYFISTNPKKNEGYEDTLRTFYRPYKTAAYDILIYKKFSTDQSH